MYSNATDSLKVKEHLNALESHDEYHSDNDDERYEEESKRHKK
jgi:hypothetical protein